MVALNFSLPKVYPATLTLEAIAAAIKVDQGATFRRHLKDVTCDSLARDGDAFNGDEVSPFRWHLGASSIGGDCARAMWYGFRWVTQVTHEGQLLRLFNRGHLEELRFAALLRTIGCTIWTHDGGQQYRMSAHGGHFGGSLDIVVLGIPECPTEPLLTECKTHNSDWFAKVKTLGVREAKPEHFVQMQTYMGGFALRGALYLAVCKDTDELWAELVPFQPEVYAQSIEKAGLLVQMLTPPRRISETPGWWRCKICPHVHVCHYGAPPALNCRTCANVQPMFDGSGWRCGQTGARLYKRDQLAACSMYLPLRMT